MKYCSWIVILFFFLMFSNIATSQDIPFIKKKQFKLNPRVTQSDYQQGVLYVKVKPEYTSSGLQKHDIAAKNQDIYQALEIRNISPFVSQKQLNKAKARKARPFKYNIRAYHQIQYDNTSVPLEQAVNLLYQTGMFEIVEPAWTYKMAFEPNDSLLSRQYYLELVKTFEAWDITQGSEEIVIAIVDSGIDRDHPDIVDNLWYNEADTIDGLDNDDNGYIDDYRGWDFGGAVRSDPDDEDNDPRIIKGGSHSHGTGVGGLAGATVNNEIGLAGIGYHSKLLFTKHMADDMTDAELSLLNTYSGVLYAASLGVDVINCSWGSSFRSQIAQDIMNYVVEDLDIVVVAAAGNTGQEEDDHYPSAYDNVLSVSAVDAQLRKSTFTTYGKTVDITAPGSGIAVLEYNNDFGNEQGTSFSSPIVAGAVGLVRAHRPELNAQQVSELVRVTANDTIYDINTSITFKNKLGKGILDIEEALTATPPSIRLQKYRLLNAEGKTPGLGEDGFLVATFKNFLWPSSGGLKVKLTSKSTLFQVLKDESALGKIEMNQEVTNIADPFEIRISETVPTNVRVDLILEFFDGSFYDYQFISVLLNPTFLNIEENLISSTVAQNGRLGYQDTEQSEGLGFIFDDQNVLFEMGLLLGTSESNISNNVRTENQEYDDDFVTIKRIRDLNPGDLSSSEIIGSFDDSNAGSSASEVEVKYRSMVWKESPNDQYYIIEYTIYNRSRTPLNKFHVGLFADWDISDNGQSDRALWHDELSLGYIFNIDTADNNQIFGGIQALSGTSQYYAIDNDEDNSGNPFGIYDGFTDEEKFQSISSGIARDSAGFSIETGADVSHSVGSGPYSVASNDSIVVAFAIHGASTLEDLIASAKAADTMYNYTLKAPRPIVPDVTVCYDTVVTIQATGATNYKWYYTKTGGDSFFTGDEYTTGILKQDTLFYVSNADNSWESVRTPVNIFLKANPSITISGSLSLCDNDTLFLISNEADTYLWSPGNETTQSLTVTQADIYNVTVSDTIFGCESTSENIVVQKFQSPEALFEVNPQEINKNVEVEITMTDLSTDASSWFWQLSDGKSSIEQNPKFTVNTFNEILVKLTITANNGCQDTASAIIDVITGLEEPMPDRGWEVYPNPTNTVLRFDLNNETFGPYFIIIYNLAGKVMRVYELNKESKAISEQIDLIGIPRGLYLIRLDQEQEDTLTKRIIIR